METCSFCLRLRKRGKKQQQYKLFYQFYVSTVLEQYWHHSLSGRRSTEKAEKTEQRRYRYFFERRWEELPVKPYILKSVKPEILRLTFCSWVSQEFVKMQQFPFYLPGHREESDPQQKQPNEALTPSAVVTFKQC